MTDLSVLVVEDNDDIRLLAEGVLSLAGMDVRTVASGPEALAELRARDLPDVILLDVQMPGMDGWQVLQAVRADSRWRDIGVVMCTVKGRAVDMDRGWAMGCDAYITKPYDIDALVGTVQGVASAHAERQVR